MNTIEDQVNNYFNKHGYDFTVYMDVLYDLGVIAVATSDTAVFGSTYTDCVKQIKYLERIVKEKFNEDGEEIKND